MDRAGKMDFRASGVALDSSALIYLMKSKLLLTLQEPPALPKSVGDFVPPPLFLPLRHELTSTTIQNLYEVLKNVIETEKMFRPNRTTQQTSILPPPSDIMPQFDIFIAELELQMDKLYSRLTEKVKGIGIIDFSTLTKGLTRMESIRTIIYLLFLAQNGKVSLWQDEQTEELYIAVGDLNFGKIEKPSIND
jgi:chromatin segregation and condensation protein Rec8/ScpA/Scc1 (kleisin family)